jgi:hypothetical protein
VCTANADCCAGLNLSCLGGRCDQVIK